jgi:hypothetical protein
MMNGVLDTTGGKMIRDSLGCIPYILAVYRHPMSKKIVRVLQVVNDIDSLSPGILARTFGDDAILRVGYDNVQNMLASVPVFAHMAKCQYIEVDCKVGCGSYKWMRTPKQWISANGMKHAFDAVH